MENEKTFGRFLISKRQENEISARQLAIALDYSAVYAGAVSLEYFEECHSIASIR